MKIQTTLFRYMITLLPFLVISPIVTAQTLQIVAKSTSIRELEDELLAIHKFAVASNLEIKIIGDTLEDHRDLETSTTTFIDVKGLPARIELKNDNQKDVIVTAEHIVYDVATGLITATTNAEINWNKSYSKGHKVIYKLDGKVAECFSDETDINATCLTYLDSEDFAR